MPLGGKFEGVKEGVSYNGRPTASSVPGLLEGPEELGFEDAAVFVGEGGNLIPGGVRGLSVFHLDVETGVTADGNHQGHLFADFDQAVRWRSEGTSS